MERIYILDYNNYSNRHIKRPYSVISSYDKYIIYNEFKCNFNENDKVNTTFVAGRQSNSYDGTGNYFIVTNNNDDDVISR